MQRAHVSRMNPRRVATNVLVAAIDFSEIAPFVVRAAFESVREMNAGQIHFVHAHPSPESDPVAARQCEKLGEWLEGLLAHGAAVPPGTQVLVHETSGDPGRTVVELAGKLGAACILVGARARDDGASTMLGSVAKAVVRDALCPVFVVRPQGASRRASVSMATEPG
jgi:nucleotide-binding universal stress UspA family protein